MSTTCAVQPRVLIADDQPDLLDALQLLLKGEGIEMEAVMSPEAVLTAVGTRTFDLLLMDLNYTGDTTSGREGIDLLARVQAIDGMLPVVVMTGWGSVDLAVEAMRRGVRDFVQKPWDNGQLVATLRAEIEDGRARRHRAELEQRELEEARRIQRKLLPSTMPQIDGWEIASWWQPASGVGGDCFDALSFGENRLALSIADVVGKGIPAALLMSNLQAAVRAFATDAAQPSELCQQVNRILCGHIAEGRFISFFYCVVDADLGTLTFSNAGHYAPILVRANGDVERLDSGGAVLGIFPDGAYEQGRVTVGCGDRLILFTDGITEARNAQDLEFGEEQLIALAVENRVCSAPALQARLAQAVADFTGGRFQDDATLIVMAAE
ncbi:MAG TPA: SpoIIE family protein phosphatase [Vicinamibacterales bacterium]|jgi:sigma-B regulation protein RsbU (phosphoserine phosphatase)|nr:SpoIIE family protein phosphatase [Vicinamibacterales bacterium]